MTDILENNVGSVFWTNRLVNCMNKKRTNNRSEDCFSLHDFEFNQTTHDKITQLSGNNENLNYLLLLSVIGYLYGKNDFHNSLSILSSFHTNGKDYFFVYKLNFESETNFGLIGKSLQQQFNESLEYGACEWIQINSQLEKNKVLLDQNSFDLVFHYNAKLPISNFAKWEINVTESSEILHLEHNWDRIQGVDMNSELFFLALEKCFTQFEELSQNSNIAVNLNPIWSKFESEEKIEIEELTELEGRIKQIWEETLNQEDLTLNHDFFDSGGASIKAVEIIAKTNEAFGIEMEIDELFIHSELASFANQVNQKIESTRSILNDKPSLILLFDDTGKVPFGKNFIKNISEYYTCHFVPFTRQHLAPTNFTITDLAQDALAILTAKNKLLGELNILAYSAGTLVALELESLLEKPVNLFLIDPPPTRTARSSFKFTEKSESEFIRELFLKLNLDVKYEDEGELHERWKITVEMLNAKYPNVGELKNRLNVDTDPFLSAQDSIEQLCEAYNTIRSINCAVGNYENSKRILNKIHLFHSVDGDADVQEWSSYNGTIERFELKGNHRELLNESNIDIVQTALIQRIN